jgi:hypothetical protein
LVFGESPGSFEICPICFWEDDIVQLAFPDCAGGANGISLLEAQQTFILNGVCEARFRAHVRPPGPTDKDPHWRPLNPGRDRFLSWFNKKDHKRWKQSSGDICLYYWLPDYWLNESNS